ncbi:ferredoxin [Clostridium algifaecis]|uniref:Ferredoxin n=1 Tax=Clostridium algifaecis TaxID=1472040 RepID=A0ABS4KQK2_9CLOT|nr:ferredoxin [Clostridium algifaecis]MBP2032318.1 ferredoxin [Clostridium algifaecis]
MNAIVNKDTCISCGLCESICPEVFTIEEDGKAGVLVDEVPETLEDDSVEARDSCPVDAISIEN